MKAFDKKYPFRAWLLTIVLGPAFLFLGLLLLVHDLQDWTGLIALVPYGIFYGGLLALPSLAIFYLSLSLFMRLHLPLWMAKVLLCLVTGICVCTTLYLGAVNVFSSSGTEYLIPVCYMLGTALATIFLPTKTILLADSPLSLDKAST